ncbi:four helix bundle protein [Parabacteroides sp. PF5-5]|uniref:four helix bundle protein n=1 Tax=unclassified Parabacteroides TaxID=2649774 RepID=UPI002475BB08|nr:MULTISPECIES: four helix bundle protein [unclassified Parabacteroides]MDH6304575.1 four helix bundle protein [Parabacteroides sp. PH5-39]MDH6315812.1 four helix bundle protein [Parabacteroides sp. PF5-13]MDH6319471.1 four helix bundle protein [Parabacteroides sp. PH5-13]MDH6323202.1 four helix bundle protein [Parabacteroides sp. PH5-8]MDH6327004.1 four helix bundle protein [Parabacteroides sp. PH5-41]
MKPNPLKEKSFRFALRIVKLYKYLNTEEKEFVLSKQLLRSGTSIGAMQRESEHAESKPDFIHKLSIAQKECNESLYWLELLYKTDYISEKAYSSIYNDAEELMKLITAIIKKTKSINN